MAKPIGTNRRQAQCEFRGREAEGTVGADPARDLVRLERIPGDDHSLGRRAFLPRRHGSSLLSDAVWGVSRLSIGGSDARGVPERRNRREVEMSASEAGTARPGLQVGPTSEFSLFFRVKPDEGETLRAALRDLQDTPGYRPGDYDVAIATIHEARFVLFDDDTQLAFITSFDGPWDAYMEDFFTSGPTLALFDAIFRHVEGFEGLPDLAAVKAFINGAQQPAAAYARNYPGTVKEIKKAQRVNNAFQAVLDDPNAGTAMQDPALKPLLDEAAD